MLRNTRSCVRNAVTAALLVAVAIATPVFAASDRAPPLPPAVADLAPSLKPQGGGLLRFFGLSIYDGWYWSSVRGWPHDGPYALDLIYHRSLSGKKIAERSVDEITGLGYGTQADRRRWGQLMERVFPDVRAGDRLTGVNLGSDAVRYFYNGKLIGEISDPGFAQAFFGIWLNPNTSQSEFREKLLGVR